MSSIKCHILLDLMGLSVCILTGLSIFKATLWLLLSPLRDFTIFNIGFYGLCFEFLFYSCKMQDITQGESQYVVGIKSFEERTDNRKTKTNKDVNIEQDGKELDYNRISKEQSTEPKIVKIKENRRILSKFGKQRSITVKLK